MRPAPSVRFRRKTSSPRMMGNLTSLSRSKLYRRLTLANLLMALKRHPGRPICYRVDVIRGLELGDKYEPHLPRRCLLSLESPFTVLKRPQFKPTALLLIRSVAQHRTRLRYIHAFPTLDVAAHILALRNTRQCPFRNAFGAGTGPAAQMRASCKSPWDHPRHWIVGQGTKFVLSLLDPMGSDLLPPFHASTTGRDESSHPTTCLDQSVLLEHSLYCVLSPFPCSQYAAATKFHASDLLCSPRAKLSPLFW